MFDDYFNLAIRIFFNRGFEYAVSFCVFCLTSRCISLVQCQIILDELCKLHKAEKELYEDQLWVT